MSRTAGAIGKTETKRQLKERIKELEDRLKNAPNGESQVVDHKNDPDPDPESDPPEVDQENGDLKIKTPPPDRYLCGGCRKELSKPETKCPFCGVGLSW